MKKATLKNNIIHKTILALICIILVSANTVSATPIAKIDGGGKDKKTVKKLTTDEFSLLQKLEKEHRLELKTIKTEELETTDYKKVLVYDMAGNLLQEQDSQKATINLSKLPKNAKLLTVDNDLAIYVVL